MVSLSNYSVLWECCARERLERPSLVLICGPSGAGKTCLLSALADLLRERISQPVFARYLNVSKNLVSDWERGVKKPGGPALRLLTVIGEKGLRAIA